MARPIGQLASTETPTDESALCAWCLEEQGITPNENDSHGACQPHAERLLVNHYTNKFNATPSYVERFRDGREAW